MIPNLPATDSIRELADFWDRHDLTDFADELAEVEEPAFERSHTGATVIELSLDATEADALDRIARSEQRTREDVLHGWVRQHIGAGKR